MRKNYALITGIIFLSFFTILLFSCKTAKEETEDDLQKKEWRITEYSDITKCPDTTITGTDFTGATLVFESDLKKGTNQWEGKILNEEGSGAHFGWKVSVKKPLTITFFGSPFGKNIPFKVKRHGRDRKTGKEYFELEYQGTDKNGCIRTIKMKIEEK